MLSFIYIYFEMTFQNYTNYWKW